jgi:hypothetical protein
MRDIDRLKLNDYVLSVYDRYKAKHGDVGMELVA